MANQSIPDKFKHYFWGENKLFFPDEEYVIKLSFPRMFVRYNVGDAYFESFEEFVTSIAEIQFLDGERPSDEEVQEHMVDIWNYVALCERQLEEDMEAMRSEMDDDDY